MKHFESFREKNKLYSSQTSVKLFREYDEQVRYMVQPHNADKTQRIQNNLERSSVHGRLELDLSALSLVYS